MKKALVLSGGGGRGAYQAGVLKYLEEIHYKPNIICGTSVGAITAVAIGSGMSAGKVVELWQSIEREKVMKYSIWGDILKKQFKSLADTTPLKHLLYEKIDFETLRKSDKEIIITAVNILNAELVYFKKKEIDIEHVMASAAIPVIFPWQYVNGEPHWDGGIMANTPIMPALECGAKEIVVVLLSPVGGDINLGTPTNRREALERVFELSLIGSYKTVLAGLDFNKKKKSKNSFFSNLLSFKGEDIRLKIICPKNSLGLSSILNFTQEQADSLISMGYMDAKTQMNLE